MNMIDNAIKNIIGQGKSFGGKRDLDGDGVRNRKDCQPRNTMRQDKSKVADYTLRMKAGKDSIGKLVYQMESAEVEYKDGTLLKKDLEEIKKVYKVLLGKRRFNKRAFEY